MEQEQDQWEEVGTLVKRKGAASYRIYPAQAKLNGKTYRFLVVQSDHMEAQKEKTIQSNLEKEQRSWHKDQAELESQDFACEADAEEALTTFLKHHRKGYQRHGGSRRNPGQTPKARTSQERGSATAARNRLSRPVNASSAIGSRARDTP
ncbi:hypothetical protein SAMN04488123_105210 [Natribacillus halophilus]|uniref:Uncharacterized protein n=1 Tax=Natribacillus halophilus TaxID=549003 RepID=A0A1G8N578_9BACI|nr:hypothetical protein SAMN04488123_105210 [Natribacillus halophilus]